MKRFLYLSAACLMSSTPTALAQSETESMDTVCVDCCPEIMDTRQYRECTEDMTSDEIVSVGTIIGHAMPFELSSPVSALTAEDIENRNQTYVGELLRALPGVSVNRSGPGGALTQIRMRGNEASHVLVLIDGVEVANPVAGEFDLSGISASDIVKIEVLRGEQSALYGSDAVGGVINIMTHAGTSRKLWQANVEAGSFGTVSGQLTGVVPIGNASLSVAIGGVRTDGYDISGLGGEKDGSKSRNVNFGLNHVNVGGVKLSAKYSDTHLSTDFDEDLFFSGRLDDTQSETRVDTQTARISADFDVAGLENQITLSGHNISTDSRASFPSISDGTRRNARWAVKKSFDQHAITVLGETERETYTITPNLAFVPTDPEINAYAIAGDYRYESDYLSLTASARQDFNDRFADAFTWKLGGTYGFDFGGRVRASVGTAVKNPSLIELFGFYPEANFAGNPDLKPEESLGYNIGYTQELMSGDLKLSADYFRSDLEDEIFTDFSGFPFVARNRINKSRREGVELTVNYDPFSNINLYGSATFLKAEENDTPEIRRPEFLASFTASWSPVDALTLTASADHTGRQLDTDFSTFSVVVLDAFTLVGLNAAYDINEIITLTLRGENLWDEDYQEVVGYASQGRGIFGGLRARFE
ncbi:MAG: TonB-dependent receptor [Hellea sp.]|nr:TonB-dependent receptor [Hellea sp.]